MIVDDVENDGQALLMTCVNQCLQVIGAAVLVVVDGILVGRAVGVAINPLELGDGKQFDGGESHAADVIELGHRGLKRAPAGRPGVELAGVHFIDYELA